MAGAPEDFRPTASWAALRQRAALRQTVRRFFDARGFLEVETPLLSSDTVVDLHLDPLQVTLFDDPRSPTDGPATWLQTSPEFGMKRLVAAGATAIYQLTRAFRGAERGPLHNPEFTILEWYRVGDDMSAGMQLLDELAQATLDRGPAERLSYAAAFRQAAGVDPLHDSTAALAEAARRHGFQGPVPWAADDRDAWLDWLLVSRVAPTLGQTRPAIMFDYPASQAALAVIRPEDVPVAERFELFVDGIELANGYHELTDAAPLRARFAAANRARTAAGKCALPTESRLLHAMEQGLPPCTGVALGFDRLVMVALEVTSLSEVLAFPMERA